MPREYKGPGLQPPRDPPVLDREGSIVRLNDYDAALYLFACNVPIVSAHQLTEDQREFVFRDKKGEAESRILELLNRESMLQPLDVLDAQRWFKKLLYKFKGRRAHARYSQRRSVEHG